MDSNTHSTRRRARLAALTAEIDAFLAEDLDGLTDAALTEEILELRPQVDRLEGGWLQRLAAADARGAAGAEQDRQFGSTAAWLRVRLRMAATTAATQVRTARALFRGPLPETGTALCAGEISVAHAEVLAAGTKDLPDHVAMDAEPTLLDAARRLDPTGLRQVVTHLEYTVDPDRADAAAQRRYERRGLWVTTTMDRMVAVRGILHPEAGQTLIAALDPLARPADQHDTRTGGQRTADALTELARQRLEGGQLPITGGVRPQLSVIIDLHSLGGQPGGIGGEIGRIGGEVGWAAPLPPEACRRLACDATLTRVIVSRQPLDAGDHCHGGNPNDPTAPGLEGLLRAVLAKLPPALGGAPSQPLDVGRAGPPASSPPPNAVPWLSATAAVCSQAVRGRWPGARAIMCATGWRAAPPTWPTWLCCAGPIIGRCMRTAGGSSEDPTASTPPPHHTENTGPPERPLGGRAGHPSACDAGPTHRAA